MESRSANVTAREGEGTSWSAEMSVAASFNELLRAIGRHAFVVAAVAALVFGGVVYWVSTLPRIYEAKALVLVERHQGNVLGFQSAVEDGSVTAGSVFLSREFFKVQETRLHSPDLAERVVGRLGLLHLEEFWEETDESSGVERSRDRAVARLRARLGVESNVEARTLTISFRHQSPLLAANIANEYARLFVEGHLERRLESTDSALRWLQQQFQELNSDLNSVELQMYRFLRDRNIFSFSRSDRSNPRVLEIESIGSQLVSVRLEVDRLSTIVRQIERAMARGDVLEAGIEGLVDNALIQGLKTRLVETRAREVSLAVRYGPGWDELRAVQEQRAYLEGVLESEVNQVLSAYRRQYENVREVEGRLQSRLARAQAEAIEFGQNEIEFGSLERQAESFRDLVGLMERRLRELELARMLEHNAMQVIDRASAPSSPASPRVLLLWAAGLMLGLFLGALAGLLMDYIDSTVRTREELQQQFGLTWLGMIPRIERSALKSLIPGRDAALEGAQRDRYVHLFPRSVVAESCRSIRTNLLFINGDKRLTAFVVTSASPREGKSLTSSSLATVLAQSGSRVLLIDADMRKPRLHRVFQASNELGLSSVLTGEATLEESAQETMVEGLTLLTCGPVPKDSTGLLHSPRFAEALALFKSRFDIVILDTPPLGPVTDAAVIATHVDGALLVVKQNSTRRDILAHAVDQLHGSRARILGVVLNDVDLTKRRAGYYGYYYRRYGHYYGENEADGKSAKA